MIDMTGQVYNDLTVLSFHHFDEKKNSYWLCKCSCGKETIVRRSHLLSGGVSSCGCKRIEKCGKASTKHGAWAKNKRLYKIWSCMIYRGTGKRKREYYFDRGIFVCDEWKDVNIFFDWALSNGYKEGLEIDRIDNNKGYFPENCRWATREEQMNNTRKTRMVFFEGKKYTLKELSQKTNVDLKLIKSRLYKGWDIERIINEKKH